MAKLKATPKNFEQAVEVLKDRISMRLGNNTYLEVTDSDPLHGFIGVRLHSTYIVKFWPDGQTTLHTGGWYTSTTKDRINQFISGHVYQSGNQWYYTASIGQPNGMPVRFSEGMNVSSNPRFDYSRKCECGAPWDNDTQGFRCANKGEVVTVPSISNARGMRPRNSPRRGFIL